MYVIDIKESYGEKVDREIKVASVKRDNLFVNVFHEHCKICGFNL